MDSFFFGVFAGVLGFFDFISLLSLGFTFHHSICLAFLKGGGWEGDDWEDEDCCEEGWEDGEEGEEGGESTLLIYI